MAPMGVQKVREIGLIASLSFLWPS